MDKLSSRKRIGLVAHDHKKDDLIVWVRYDAALLERHDLVATGTTGRLLETRTGMAVRQLRSGPLGGDLQLGALIAEGRSTCWCSSGTRSSRRCMIPT